MRIRIPEYDIVEVAMFVILGIFLFSWIYYSAYQKPENDCAPYGDVNC